MARRYSRRRGYTRRVKTAKYSNETYCHTDSFTTTDSSINGYFSIVPVTTTLGMRKVKNFTFTVAYKSTQLDQISRSVYWALVYVPQGTTPSPMNIGTGGNFLSLYEPNQNVIMSGIAVLDEQSRTFKTRLARNLNSGDYIALVLQGDTTGSFTDILSTSCNYAISY